MNMEQPAKMPSRLETLLHTLEDSPESFDDLEASMLLLDADSFLFRKKMIELGRMGKTFELIFVMDDLGATDDEKKRRLRQLKAIREDQKLKNIVTKITVKGRAGEQSIEPNVFSSDVWFEEINE